MVEKYRSDENQWDVFPLIDILFQTSWNLLDLCKLVDLYKIMMIKGMSER